MGTQNGTMTLKEAKVRYLKRAKELVKSAESKSSGPDLYVADQIGEMAIILIRLFKQETGKQLTNLEEIKLYQQILAELGGEKEPDFLKAD